MVKATIKKHIGEVKQKNTGEALRPLVVATSENVYWYSTHCPHVGFCDISDACTIERYMITGENRYEAMLTLKKGVVLKSER